MILRLCTLSAKDRGATKNPAVDLELILMHHFSRILCLDLSSVLSKALNSYFKHLNNHSKYGRPKVLKSVIYAPRSLPTVSMAGKKLRIKTRKICLDRHLTDEFESRWEPFLPFIYFIKHKTVLQPFCELR